MFTQIKLIIFNTQIFIKQCFVLKVIYVCISLQSTLRIKFDLWIFFLHKIIYIENIFLNVSYDKSV